MPAALRRSPEQPGTAAAMARKTGGEGEQEGIGLAANGVGASGKGGPTCFSRAHCHVAASVEGPRRRTGRVCDHLDVDDARPKIGDPKIQVWKYGGPQ